jgi:hypothetical protein
MVQIKDFECAMRQDAADIPQCWMTHMRKLSDWGFEHNPNRAGRPPPLDEVILMLPKGQSHVDQSLKTMIKITSAQRGSQKKRLMMANGQCCEDQPPKRRRYMLAICDGATE